MLTRIVNLFLFTSIIALVSSSAFVGCVTTNTTITSKLDYFSEVETKVDSFAKKHVFRVLIERDGESMSSGTGFIASVKNSQGKDVLVIVTAKHVCENARTTALDSANDDMYSSDVIGIGKFHDVCFMTVSPRLPIKTYYEFSTEELPPDTDAVALGYPGIGLVRFTLRTMGLEIPPNFDGVELMHFKGWIYPGQSGGPIVNPKNNKVIGINRAYDKRYSYGVPASKVLEEAKRVLK